jgi:exodeoxyribonuclease VII large subunit
MENFINFERSTWSVSDLTHYLRELFVNDALLQDVWVLGEVSNFARPASGHIYFTVKDSSASIRSVMWRNRVQLQKWLPKDGDLIEVHGAIDIYEAGGQYQLYADQIRPIGEGALFQQFLQLKAQLESEGLFDIERKKQIPRFPNRIGIITSPTGAAIRDILNTLRRRYPIAEIILAPTAVQGVDAPPQIITALSQIQKVAPDVIILARGGGSIEDLWAFNDEDIARAIANSSIPIVTGIGHETDFCIADFVSDLRAPTPTAAAELVTPDKNILKETLTGSVLRINTVIRADLNNKQEYLQKLTNQLVFISPLNRIGDHRQSLDEQLHRISLLNHHQYKFWHSNIHNLSLRLNTLSPLNILHRGYAIVTNAENQIVHSTGMVKQGDELDIQVSDGHIPVRTLPAADN